MTGQAPTMLMEGGELVNKKDLTEQLQCIDVCRVKTNAKSCEDFIYPFTQETPFYKSGYTAFHIRE